MKETIQQEKKTKGCNEIPAVVWSNVDSWCWEVKQELRKNSSEKCIKVEIPLIFSTRLKFCLVMADTNILDECA